MQSEECGEGTGSAIIQGWIRTAINGRGAQTSRLNRSVQRRIASLSRRPRLVRQCYMNIGHRASAMLPRLGVGRWTSTLWARDYLAPGSIASANVREMPLQSMRSMPERQMQSDTMLLGPAPRFPPERS